MLLLSVPAARAENGPLYDPDPNHLWNRLHQALFVRTTSDGTEYGFDQLDPLLWSRSKHLLEGASHKKAVKVLDEFLAHHGEKLIGDPLKRAVLQRDLWAVFDWTAHGWPEPDPAKARAQNELQTRLAAVIQRLAMTSEEINALPDNFADAVKSSKFAAGDYDPAKPDAPFLPEGSVRHQRPLGLHPASTARNESRRSMQVSLAGGPCFWFLCERQTGGRRQSIIYSSSANFRNRSFTKPTRSSRHQSKWRPCLIPICPSFRTEQPSALVRQMILVDQNDDLVPTHLTESVQLRRYNDVHPKPGPYGKSHPNRKPCSSFCSVENCCSPGPAGGLRAVAPDETEFRQFMDKGSDPIDAAEKQRGPLSLWMHPAMDCMECHGGAGLFSVSSFLQRFQGPTANLPQRVAGVDVGEQRNAARVLKQSLFSWGKLLKGLWEKPRTAPIAIHTGGQTMMRPKRTRRRIRINGRARPEPFCHLAASRGLTNEVETLIAKGADVNDKGFGNPNAAS